MGAEGISRRKVTIFVSSPNDVLPERIQVEQSVDRLRPEFSTYFELEVVRWEERPVHAGDHPQRQLPQPSAADIVIVIVWSRLGTPLIHRSGWDGGFAGPLSGGEVTGTEWEFENALQGFQRSRERPVVRFYKKLGVPAHRTDDEVRAYLRDKELLDRFIERWFHDSTTGALLRALTEFGELSEFEQLVDRDLHELLMALLEQEHRARPVTWTTSPFVGLVAYDVTDAPIFFGRDHARAALRRLVADRAVGYGDWVLVTGASGCGKSSLVRAGLIADLQRPGLVEGVGECRHAIIRPSGLEGETDPVAAVAQQLLSTTALPELTELRYDSESIRAQLSAGQGALPVRQGLDLAQRDLSRHYRVVLVLVVDQLEEIFLLPAQQRNELMRALGELTRDDDVWLVATMRSDALQLLDEDAVLARRFPGVARHLVAPPTEPELERIITRPARSAGVEFEQHSVLDERLSHRILEDARRDRVSLPLIEHTLQQLWLARTPEGVLTYRTYDELGGLGGGIGRSADELLEQQHLDPDHLDALRRAMLSMARLGDDQTWSRRVVRKDALDPTIRPVIAVLEEHRLLVADERGSQPTVELAHEELFRSWDLLAGWLRESLPDHRLLRELEVAAESHLSNPGDPDRLWRGTRLDRARELLSAGVLPMDEAVRGFIDASEAEAAAARAREERSRSRRLRRVTGAAIALAVLAVAAVIASILARQQAERADDNAVQTKAVELAAMSDQLADRSLDVALLLGVESARRRDSPDVEDALVSTLDRLPELDTILRGHEAEVRDVAVMADGTVVSGGRDGRIVWWNADGTIAHSAEVHREVHGLDAVDDGVSIISTTDDGMIRRWDGGGEEVWAAQAHTAEVRRAEVDPLGRWVASASHDGSVRLTDLDDGSEVQRLWPALDDRELQVDVTVSPHGTFLATVGLDGDVVVFDTADWEVVERIGLESTGRAADFHPELDHVLAVGESSGRVSLIDIRSLDLISVHEHEERVFDVNFDRAGERLASASRDQRVLVTGVQVDDESMVADETHTVLDAHGADVRAARFGPDGRLISGSRDRTVMIWNPDLGSRLSTRPLGDAPAYDVEMTGSGSLAALMAPGPDGSSLIGANWDLAVELPVRSFEMAALHGGELFVIGQEDGHIRFVARNDEGAAVSAHQEAVRAVAAAPDGRHVATGGADGSLIIWNVDRKDVENQTQLQEHGVVDLAFADDDRVFVADENGSLWSWNHLNGDLSVLADNRLRARSLAVTTDGASLIVGTDQEQVQVWSLDDAEPAVSITLDHEGEATSVAVDDSGRLVATSLTNDTVTMWDLDTGRRRGQLTATQPRAAAVDGSDRVAVATVDGVEVWNLDLDPMVEIACRLANRNLTEEEWDRWVGGPYRRTCPAFPLPEQP